MMKSSSNGPASPSNTPSPATIARDKARQAATNALVEAAARGALRDMAPLPDLLTAGFPFTPALWMIVVEPLQPREESDGGIAVVDLSQEAEQYQMTVGRVLKAGPAAFEGQTTGGIKLDNFTADIHRPEDLVGKHVTFCPDRIKAAIKGVLGYLTKHGLFPDLLP